jgi:hypothetical protein
MLAVVEDARKAYVDEVLASIGDECRHLYARIHPDEGLGSPNLCMAGEQRRSVDLTAEFEGEKGVPPQGYFSESHLDTLGFCVWLALARREDLKSTVLVLDDIFTSVDAQHLSRLIPLISDVAREFAQVIVTTHYRNWRDRYRLGQAPGMQAQLLELHRWTLERGVSLSSTKLAVEELETKLAAQPLDRQAVASQAGILLEAVLDYLALLYRRRLPRSNDGEWTLGELLDASRKLVKVLTIERDVSGSPTATGPDGKQAKAAVQAVGDVVAPFYQEAGQLSFIRNEVGCHFNVAGAEVSDIDVHAFGTATAAFVRGLECGHCGEIPSRRKGDHFACGCGKTKMKPLECTG